MGALNCCSCPRTRQFFGDEGTYFGHPPADAAGENIPLADRKEENFLTSKMRQYLANYSYNGSGDYQHIEDGIYPHQTADSPSIVISSMQQHPNENHAESTTGGPPKPFSASNAVSALGHVRDMIVTAASTHGGKQRYIKIGDHSSKQQSVRLCEIKSAGKPKSIEIDEEARSIFGLKVYNGEASLPITHNENTYGASFEPSPELSPSHTSPLAEDKTEQKLASYCHSSHDYRPRSASGEYIDV